MRFYYLQVGGVQKRVSQDTFDNLNGNFPDSILILEATEFSLLFCFNSQKNHFDES